jgi:sialic acid synthase SpsE
MKIANFDLSTAERPLIIAEIGGAHNGSKHTMLTLMERAASAGADMIKIQAFTPDTITAKFDRPEFIITSGQWKGRHLHDLYAETHTPRAWFPEIFVHAQTLGVPVFPSVFSIEDIEFVKQFAPPALKIASFELVDPILIKAAAWAGVPLILSTGMASWGEIYMADRAALGHPSAWLHCISNYPTETAAANLRFMDVLRRSHAYVGLSDHSLGNEVAMMATARGACIIEKHITMTPGGSGADDGFATGYEDWPAFVQAVHRAASALGPANVDWKTGARDDSDYAPLRRSLYVVEDVREGDMFTSVNVRSIRPGLGMAPGMYPRVMGALAKKDIPAGTPLAESMVAGMGVLGAPE